MGIGQAIIQSLLSPFFYDFGKYISKLYYIETEWLVIKFKTLEEAESVYGKGSLVGISKIDQIIFYTRHGLQPELTLPSDKVDGHIVCWFHKNKTKLIYQRWNEERLKNEEQGC